MTWDETSDRYTVYAHGNPNIAILLGTYYVGIIALLMGLEEASVQWAVEEHGRCDTDEYVVVPYERPYPGPMPSAQPETATDGLED